MGGQGSGRYDHESRHGGRPATGIQRVALTITMQPEEKQKILELAALSQMSVSRFIVKKCLGDENA